MGSLPKPHADFSNTQPTLRSQALVRLLQACDAALEARQDLWQFALQLPALRAEGIPDTVLRQLVAQGLAGHARETTEPQARTRSVQPLAHLRFSEQSCFVLTAAGVAVARPAAAPRGDQTSVSEMVVRPIWDGTLRELRLRAVVVKSFRQRAANQELILCAFEEEGWPPRIDDPLAPAAEQDPKRRLHYTIRNLNRGQVQRLIHFEGGGDGQSIRWRLWKDVEASDATATPLRR
jgi:hypothetical protein